ncbi:MAG: glutamine-hydrolyzing GMP synthase [Candidatus Levybacteria bacterium]|nr:glutamine-hydrolyzing GMP synthase [Candidatus Levybacteria bacterium]
MIFVVDFGSQTTHLLGRRIRELGVDTKIVQPDEILRYAQNDKDIKGVILSGGPSSVYSKGAPTIDPQIFDLKIPILGICYGLQLTTYLLGGKVVAGRKEYGPAKLKIENLKLKITNGLQETFVVWMSHGDEVVALPEGFKTLGSTGHVPFAFVEDSKRKIIGLQFHPEVEHTENGLRILKNFIVICQGSHPAQSEGSRDSSAIPQNDIIENIKTIVGDSYVIGAVSGGVDSTVAATLTAKAIGKRFIPIHVDNGLMREGTREHVVGIFKKIGARPIVVNAVGEMLKRLRKVTDSEKKRKIIGNFYIEIFERIRKKLLKKSLPVKFLLQGTIYSDVIESQGSKYASRIKSHHNVGGLPKNMKLKLLEPLRNFYKDEVREIGRRLDIDEDLVNRQPFPGPGYAVRIRGEVTKKRLEQEKKADEVVIHELEKAGILDNVFLSFPVMTGAYSTAVKGDGRHFGEVVALRVVQSKDIMTSTWAKLPYEVLQKISSRIVNEIPGISRVVYDITTKPPATMEWE